MANVNPETHFPIALVVLDDGTTEIQWAEKGPDWKPVGNEPEEQRWKNVREERNRLLTESDWSVLPDVPLSVEFRQQWQEYRQALRDVTEQQDPFNIVWPVKPS